MGFFFVGIVGKHYDVITMMSATSPALIESEETDMTARLHHLGQHFRAESSTPLKRSAGLHVHVFLTVDNGL